MNPLSKLKKELSKQMTEYVDGQVLPIAYEVYKFLLPIDCTWVSYETFIGLCLERLKGEK